jgi:FKBP-type peptidyl-prolyl cis-trans isomerase
MPSGLKIKDVVKGTGAIAERGATVTVHYRGYLNRGEQFRSSYDDGAPVRFVLGKREVIAGMDRGVLGMRVGGRRDLLVSPHLAYREQGIEGVIPPDAVLRFEIELLDVTPISAT